MVKRQYKAKQAGTAPKPMMIRQALSPAVWQSSWHDEKDDVVDWKESLNATVVIMATIAAAS